jgi:hypothetical protein
MSVNFKIGEIVKVNKWSSSFYPFEVYDPSNMTFPKQHRLFGEFSFLGIIIDILDDMCHIWVVNLEKTYYIYNKDIEKCQD